MRKAGMLAAGLLTLAVSLGAAQAPSLPPSCGPMGDLRFVCGPDGPEDLVAVPRTPWLVASAFNGSGGLYVVDTTKSTSTKVFPTAASAERMDTSIYASCPGPLQGEDRTSFRTHGLDLKPGPRSTHTLYAVHHGGRESIEVFTLDAAATPPVVTWIGCVVAPDPIGLNAVVALPDGGFAATNFDPRPPAGAQAAGVSAQVLSGDRNGEVWEWHSKAGWTKVPGSDASGANGLALSADARWYYVAQWGNRSFMRLSRGRTPVERTEIPVGFRVDNIRWARDGRTLLAAGQERALTELPAGTAPVSVIGRIDPQAMTYTELLKKPVPAGLFAATVAIEMGGDYWVGSFRGDRITRYALPPGSGQTTRQMGALAVRDKAPTDKAIDLTREDLAAVVKEMPGKNLATTRLLEGGYYSVNIRRLTGPETAHLHTSSLTIYVVREGSGTLITGGTIVDAKGQPVPDGKPGDDIKGGVERTIKAGDIIVTPPGVPHFIRDAKGPLVFMNLIFEKDK